MPRIEFSASDFGPATVVEVTQRTRLVDVCDDARAPVPFSCRSASCGTCRIRVLAGGELLEPPERDELEVLAIFGDSPTHRLACQAVVREAEGVVRLELAE